MAAGSVHERDSAIYINLSAIAGVVLSFTSPVEVAFGVIAGGFFQFLVTPDIDHHLITREEGRLIRLLGLPGWLWVAYWWPYNHLFGHPNQKHAPWHRISHTPFVGTATRMIYLLWFPMFFMQIDSVVWISCFVSWSLGDLIHIIRDAIQ